jgi:S1-C subfamily serine protease
MSKLRNLSLVTLLLSNSLLKAEISTLKQEAALSARQFTVCVTNRWSGIFNPQVREAHGTGIVADIDEANDRVRIFTNRHVVARDFLNAQALKVRIHHSDVEEPEIVSAKLFYLSRYLDFAVVEIKLSDLKRTKGFVKEAPLSKREKVIGPGGFAQGTPTMAFGHPFDSSSVSTYGEISALYRSKEPMSIGQIMIQTSAAINPGNSGGPLIALTNEGPEVIGINTAKLVGADNTGYAIPINQAIDEYEYFKETGRNDIVIMANNYGIIPAAIYKHNSNTTLKNLILERNPDFFNLFSGTLIVTEEHPKSPLKSGDVVFSVKGKVIGTELFRFRKILDEHIKKHPGEEIEIEVIRNGKFETVKVPSIVIHDVDERESFPFVHTYGTMFGEVHKGLYELEGRKGVQVYHIDPRVLQQGILLWPGSVVTRAKKTDSEFVDINSLDDFKNFLKTVAEDEVVMLEAYLGNPTIDNGRLRSALDLEDYAYARLNAKPSLIAIHVGQVVDEKKFPLSAQFNRVDLTGSRIDSSFFAGQNGQHSNGGSAAEEVSCEVVLR